MKDDRRPRRMEHIDNLALRFAVEGVPEWRPHVIGSGHRGWILSPLAAAIAAQESETTIPVPPRARPGDPPMRVHAGWASYCD